MKKFISLFTIVALIVFTISCSTINHREVKTVADWGGKDIKVFKVVKISGETVEFPKKQPGKIHKDNIIGLSEKVTQVKEIDRMNIRSINRDQNGNILEVTTEEGKMFQVAKGSAIEGEKKVTCTVILESFKSVTIPLSDVKTIEAEEIESKSFFSNILMILGAAVLAGVLIYVILYAEAMSDL